MSPSVVDRIFRLVTLAAQNALLSLVMHYSRVSTAPSETYSAGTAVLMVELLKGAISFVIAYLRIENTTAYNLPSNASPSRSSPLARLRKLWREIFRSDCWKLSIPAILYGTFLYLHALREEWNADRRILTYQSSRITCSISPPRTSTLRHSRSRIRSRS